LFEQLTAHQVPKDKHNALDDVHQLHQQAELLVLIQRLLTEFEFEWVHLERDEARQRRRRHDCVNNSQQQVDEAQQHHPSKVEVHDEFVLLHYLCLQLLILFLVLEDADGLDVFVRQDMLQLLLFLLVFLALPRYLAVYLVQQTLRFTVVLVGRDA
jgi:hypothetical protein